MDSDVGNGVAPRTGAWVDTADFSSVGPGFEVAPRADAWLPRRYSFMSTDKMARPGPRPGSHPPSAPPSPRDPPKGPPRDPQAAARHPPASTSRSRRAAPGTRSGAHPRTTRGPHDPESGPEILPGGPHLFLESAYQKLLDLVGNAAAIVGIQRGLQGMYEGTGEEADDAFSSLERELGIPEHG